jgi:hypothetical protein
MPCKYTNQAIFHADNLQRGCWMVAIPPFHPYTLIILIILLYALVFLQIVIVICIA